MTRRRWAITITASLAYLALSITFVNFIEPAKGAQVTQQHTSHYRMPADPPAWGAAEHTKFKHNKLHHSTDRTVPHKIQHRMETYAKSHDHLSPWWRTALNKSQCMLNGVWQPGAIEFCAKYGDNPTVSKINSAITRIKVICGGTGAVAYVASGMNIVSGLGGTAAGCIFDKWASKSMDWLGMGRRAHGSQPTP